MDNGEFDQTMKMFELIHKQTAETHKQNMELLEKIITLRQIIEVKDEVSNSSTTD